MVAELKAKEHAEMPTRHFWSSYMACIVPQVPLKSSGGQCPHGQGTRPKCHSVTEEGKALLLPSNFHSAS